MTGTAIIEAVASAARLPIINIKAVAAAARPPIINIKAVAAAAGLPIIKAVASAAGLLIIDCLPIIKAGASVAGPPIIKSVATAAGLRLLSWGICQLFGMWGIATIFGVPIPWITRKMMKAPGRDGFIFRDVFERDPAGYFHNLRNLGK